MLSDNAQAELTAGSRGSLGEGEASGIPEIRHRATRAAVEVHVEALVQAGLHQPASKTGISLRMMRCVDRCIQLCNLVV